MTIVDGGDATETPAAGVPDVRLEDGAGFVRVVVEGILTAAVSASARELLVEVCELEPTAVVLDLRVELNPAEPGVLSHLLDVVQRRCWAARCQLEVTSSDAEVCDALAAAGIY